MRFQPAAEGGEDGARDQRYEEQKADAEHHAERQEPRAQDTPPAGLLLPVRRAPDDIEGMLKLAEDAGGADHEGDDPRDRGHPLLVAVVRAVQEIFEGIGTGAAGKSLELSQYLGLGRMRSEHPAGDGQGDDQDRRDGEERVERQRRAQARGTMVEPGGDRLGDNAPLDVPKSVPQGG